MEHDNLNASQYYVPLDSIHMLEVRYTLSEMVIFLEFIESVHKWRKSPIQGTYSI